jgi:hypothetical protein
MDEATLIQLKNLERRAEREGWDKPPKLFALTSRRVVDLAVPNPLWDAPPRPPDLLEVMAAAAEKGVRIPGLPPKPIGFAFMFEGWMVKSEQKQKQKLTMALAEEHRLHEHRDKVEIRMIHVVSHEGSYAIVRERGGEPDVEINNMSGAITDALRRMLAAVS